MRRVPTSGGLELGILETGPWIDVVPMRPRFQPSLEDVSRVALSPVAWDHWQPASMLLSSPGTDRLKRTMRGVIAVAPEAGKSIRFLWSKDQDPVSALYAIAESESGLPYALTGALLAAATAKRLPTTAPHVIAISSAYGGGNSDGYASGPPGPRLRRAVIDELTDAVFYPQSGAPNVLVAPQGAVDRARFWLTVARRYWDLLIPDAFHRSHINEPPPSLFGLDWLAFLLFAGGLASAWLDLQDQRKLRVAGVDLDVPEPAGLRAWPQCMAWTADAIPTDALRYLIGARLPSAPPTLDRLTTSDLPPVPDADLCRGLAAALLRQAHDNAAYVPAGQFALAFPSDYPLNAWGVASLRVAASPDGLWCAAVDAQRQPGAVFHWRPGQPLRPWVVNAAVAPLVEVTLAALWRDLRIAGETAVPPLERQPGVSHLSAPVPAHSPHPSTRTLPVQRLTLFGKRTWGSSADHEAIRHRAHGVRGHLRRLHTGWTIGADARQIALEFGLPLPDGYTFVRPHVRGGDAGPLSDAPATIIHARGLQAVMTLL